MLSKVFQKPCVICKYTKYLSLSVHSSLTFNKQVYDFQMAVRSCIVYWSIASLKESREGLSWVINKVCMLNLVDV